MDRPLLRLPTLDDVRDAATLIEGQVIRTPFLFSPKLSEICGCEVFVKYENMQATSAFKERGALVKLTGLTEDERKRGVIAMSAGNHAQAVARHATRLGIRSTIVMPVTTPHVKVQATEAFGARVILEGEVVSEAQEAAARIAAEENLVWVHPYDDFDVIRGQGTIALEMLEDQPDLDVMVIPVGGGGMISGIGIAARGLKPEIEIIGAETKLYPAMWARLHDLEQPSGGNTLAEGIAVRDVGVLTLEAARHVVDDIILLTEPQIERAVSLYLTAQKTVAEGAGAAGLAAVLAEPGRFAGRKVGLVLCGGNIDPRLLASVLMRELAREERIIAIRMYLPDRPGVLGDLSMIIGSKGGNILEVSHKRTVLDIPAKGAALDITFEARSGAHAEEVCETLRQRGYEVVRLQHY
ncbi:L-threonine dehydratase catabolic TdcB [Hartmannibacter diazotrophicus]|uniref:L-threonine dehydratase catabolic TdcB n=1 Tax=Hartmannibacter diazotrophicus TaxID=1482074 RepID=A0A2C9D5V6_9HYPH|nr:threonine ammonia-lyase [Hartmannibacter diazotrophicus]SON54905.1 L-threonine dehydratase catabolic TdcB [Hartmannibacter diazotrophicus]